MSEVWQWVGLPWSAAVCDRSLFRSARMGALVVLAGCATATDIELTVPELVLDDAPFALQATVRDQHGKAMDEAVIWLSGQGALTLDGDAGRCVALGDVVVTASSGDLSTSATVRCRPGAAIVAPTRIRTQVGRELALGPTVEAGGEPVDVRIEMVSDSPAVVVADGQVRAVEAGLAVLTVRAGSLSAAIPVEVVLPYSRERVYVTVSGPDGPALVSLGRGGDVIRERALPGLAAEGQVMVDTEGARVAWIRPEGAGSHVVADAGAGDVVLGDATPNTAIGLLNGLWAWTAADGAVRSEDGAVAELPSGARFVGSDAGGSPCAVTQRGYNSALSCLRDTAWQEQAPPARWYARDFGGLVDGGNAALWIGNFKYDCGMGPCGRVLPLEGGGSGWPVGGVGIDLHSAIGGGRAVEVPGPDCMMEMMAGVGDPSWTRSAPVDPGGPLSVAPRTHERPTDPPPDLFGWKVGALSPDGALVLLGRTDGSGHRVLQTSDIVARLAGGATALTGVPVAEPLAEPRPVPWR